MSVAIKMTDIYKSYGDNVVLKNFNLEIKTGDIVALIGSSGTGKSTILGILGLIEKFDKGTLEYFGKKAPLAYSRDSTLFLRNIVSFLFQNNALVENETISENLDISLVYSNLSKKKKESLKNDVLEKVGLNCSLNQKVYNLSGGEQQRVAIAKLMLKDSKIILADEPTGSLDKNNALHVLKLLRDLNKKGKTVVVVTHDSDIANGCDRIINIEDLK